MNMTNANYDHFPFRVFQSRARMGGAGGPALSNCRIRRVLAPASTARLLAGR